jgi:catechol 2,3-dioxygenase-like lactoylglutathione lyase family enzyme
VITGIDHLVLTVRAPEEAAAFYARVLGLETVRFGAGRLALQVGAQKINLQSLGQEQRNHACIGSGDLCLLTDRPLAEVQVHIEAQGVTIVEGPVTRTGARGPMQSIYFNDPDGNLVEVSRYG